MRRMIRTRFTEMFGLEAPIMSAPMALHSGGTLAAAVSEAGGLGSFGGVSSGGPPWLRDQIALVRERTSRPFAVGFITHFLPMMTELFDVAIEARVDAIALSFAPVEPWLSRAHAAGIKVIAQVQSFELLDDAASAGADVIAIQGNEAGGHTGTMGLLPFLTRALDLGVDVPLIAAGGIGNGRALAAVLAAGADGTWIGTRFLATPEAIEVPDGYKQVMVQSDGQDTVFSTFFDRLSGMPWPEPIGVRMRRSPILDEWNGREEEAIAKREEVIGRFLPMGAPTFDPDRSPMAYGPAAAHVTAVTPAKDVLRAISTDAERLLSQAPRA